MAAKQERVAAARERADKAAAALAAFDKAVTERQTAATAFAARWTAFLKRSRVVMANLAGEYVQKALAEFHGEFAYVKPEPKTAKAIIAALDAGARIGGNGYGSSYTLNGLAPRLRMLDKAQIRAVARAEAKMERARRALGIATQQWKDAKKAAFDAGAKVSRDELATALVKRAGMKPAKVDMPNGLTDLSTWRRDSLAAEVAEAGKHLTATRKGDECPCQACASDRRREQDRADQIARIKTLPRQKVTCPTHGATIMHVGTARLSVWRETVEPLGPELVARAEAAGIFRHHEAFPIAYCPKAGWHNVLLIRAAIEKAEALAKARAKAEKAQAAALKAGAKLGAPAIGDEIAFRCPGCGTVNEVQEVYGAGDDGDDDAEAIVQCGGCGNEMLATGVARLPLVKREAA